jgi:hypothetical protein
MSRNNLKLSITNLHYVFVLRKKNNKQSRILKFKNKPMASQDNRVRTRHVPGQATPLTTMLDRIMNESGLTELLTYENGKYETLTWMVNNLKEQANTKGFNLFKEGQKDEFSIHSELVEFFRSGVENLYNCGVLYETEQGGITYADVLQKHPKVMAFRNRQDVYLPVEKKYYPTTPNPSYTPQWQWSNYHIIGSGVLLAAIGGVIMWYYRK